MEEKSVDKAREKLIAEVEDNAASELADMEERSRDLGHAVMRARDNCDGYTATVNRFIREYDSCSSPSRSFESGIREFKGKATDAYHRKNRLREERSRLDREIERFKKQTEYQVRALRLGGGQNE